MKMHLLFAIAYVPKSRALKLMSKNCSLFDQIFSFSGKKRIPFTLARYKLISQKKKHFYYHSEELNIRNKVCAYNETYMSTSACEHRSLHKTYKTSSV